MFQLISYSTTVFSSLPELSDVIKDYQLKDC